MDHSIPRPCNSREAYLLLEGACADRHILLARKTLAHQIIHRNTLALQSNHMFLERTWNDLLAVDKFLARVRLMIRKNGQTTASEYAMQQDYSLLLSGIVSTLLHTA